MAEKDREKKEAAPIESVKEKIPENFHDSSASDPVSGIKHSPVPTSDPVSGIKHSPVPASDPVSGIKHPPTPANVKAKNYHMFGREKPLHYVLGGGKFADVFLWRDKKLSCVVLGLATLVWILFEVLDYHFITFVCHVLILALSIFFSWSNVSSFINKSPPRFPEVFVPEDVLLRVASSLRVEINRSFAILRDIVSGKQLKKFLAVIAGLWFASVVGGWFNFLTLLYISFVLLLTVPVLYEKYENQVDPMVEKALAEFEKQYAAFDDKVLSQISIGPSKEKKSA